MAHVREPHEYLVEKVKQALAEDPRAGEIALDVQIAGDTIFVRGSVATEARRDALTDVVRDAAPGWDVRNETEVPDLSGPPVVENLE
ncbi:MAG TPA: BON domain-containing protein [Actinomycetota bacterium]|nr:BON domain-containing protein [Actinomycetota bacterium]